MKPQGGDRSTAPPTHNLGAKRGWVLNVTPRPLYPRERDLVPTVRKLGGPRCRSGWGTENLATLGFEPLIVHPVTSCYYSDQYVDL